MKNPGRSRFPVTVTHLPVVRCDICQQTMPHRPGQVTVVLTEHYRKAHPQVLAVSH